MASGDLPAMIAAIHRTLVALSDRDALPNEGPKPAVSIRNSVWPTHIICLNCGGKFTALKRHLSSKHGLSPAQYRERWCLPESYPIVLPSYSAERSEMAKALGLGKTNHRRGPKPGFKQRRV